MSEHRNPQARLPKPQTHHNPDAPTLVHSREACTIPKATLEEFLNHAACAARIVGHLDGAIADGPLGDHVDALVHGLTELLGDPHTLAAPVQSARWFVIGTDDESMRPHMARFRSTPHALLLRPMSSDVAGASLWWRRGAAVAGLLVLLDLVVRVLGSCGGAR